MKFQPHRLDNMGLRNSFMRKVKSSWYFCHDANVCFSTVY